MAVRRSPPMHRREISTPLAEMTVMHDRLLGNLREILGERADTLESEEPIKALITKVKESWSQFQQISISLVDRYTRIGSTSEAHEARSERTDIRVDVKQFIRQANADLSN